MATYRYEAVDQRGETYRETIEANSLIEAADLLRSSEVEVVALEAVDSAPRRYEPRGDLPPMAPRDIDVPLKSVPGGWVLVLVGGLFTVIASIFVIVGIGLLVGGEAQGLFFTLFPLVHLSVGVGLLGYALRSRSKRRRIYRDGEVVMGTIEGVGYNRKVQVNGRNPYELVWAFDVAGHRYHDKRATFDDEVMTFVPGDRLWVIYDPEDPEQSVEWPALG